jgi:hypothetical protein
MLLKNNKTDDEFFEDILSTKFQKIINKIPDEKLKLIEIIDLLGNEGLLLLIALLSVIFLIPISIPGFSTVFGIIIFFIGFSLLSNQKFWLPKRIKNKLIAGEKLRTNLKKGLKWFSFIEKISKPNRYKNLITNKIVNKINQLLILFGSMLLMIPLGLIPFSNTLPALIIIFISLGILQKDGGIIMLGYLTVLLNLIYFGLFFSSILLAFNKIEEIFVL